MYLIIIIIVLISLISIQLDLHFYQFILFIFIFKIYFFVLCRRIIGFLYLNSYIFLTQDLLLTYFITLKFQPIVIPASYPHSHQVLYLQINLKPYFLVFYFNR